MTIDANAPDEVSAFADMIVATALAVSLGIDATKIHYPKVDMTSAAGRPCVLIEGTQANTARYAEMGSPGIPGGTLTAVLYAELSVSVAQMEKYGRALKTQLGALATGLPVRGIDVDLSSDPTAAQRAADDSGGADAAAAFRSIRFTVTWGLSP